MRNSQHRFVNILTWKHQRLRGMFSFTYNVPKMCYSKYEWVLEISPVRIAVFMYCMAREFIDMRRGLPTLYLSSPTFCVNVYSWNLIVDASPRIHWNNRPVVSAPDVNMRQYFTHLCTPVLNSFLKAKTSDKIMTRMKTLWDISWGNVHLDIFSNVLDLWVLTQKFACLYFQVCLTVWEAWRML